MGSSSDGLTEVSDSVLTDAVWLYRKGDTDGEVGCGGCGELKGKFAVWKLRFRSLEGRLRKHGFQNGRMSWNWRSNSSHRNRLMRDDSRYMFRYWKSATWSPIHGSVQTREIELVGEFQEVGSRDVKLW